MVTVSSGGRSEELSRLPLENDVAGKQALDVLLVESRLAQNINRVFAERGRRTSIVWNRG